jgi:hypothetical protein
MPSRAQRVRERIVGLLRHEARKLLIPIAILTVVSSVGTAAAPGLRHHPLLLVALSPRMTFLALAAPKVSLIPFFLVGMARLTLSDPLHFILGRRHGAAAVDRIRHPVLRSIRRAASRCVPLAVFLRPNGPNLALAGANRTRLLHVIAADLVGTAVYLVLVHQIGAGVLA